MEGRAARGRKTRGSSSIASIVHGLRDADSRRVGIEASYIAAEAQLQTGNSAAALTLIAVAPDRKRTAGIHRNDRPGNSR